MGRGLFWFGAAFFGIVALSKQVLDTAFTPAEMAEGYSYAIGCMVMGIGMLIAKKEG